MDSKYLKAYTVLPFLSALGSSLNKQWYLIPEHLNNFKAGVVCKHIFWIPTFNCSKINIQVTYFEKDSNEPEEKKWNL